MEIYQRAYVIFMYFSFHERELFIHKYLKLLRHLRCVNVICLLHVLNLSAHRKTRQFALETYFFSIFVMS